MKTISTTALMLDGKWHTNGIRTVAVQEKATRPGMWFALSGEGDLLINDVEYVLAFEAAQDYANQVPKKPCMVTVVKFDYVLGEEKP